jgi:GNAT superfamily N-acetyltransferase
MGEMTDHPDHTDHAAAIEHNAAELLMEMGRLGGGEQVDEPGLRWSIGGSPIDYHNCVVHADLSPAAADRAIQASLERLRALGLPGTWHVGPSMRPLDLGRRLLTAGFRDGGTEPGMAVELSELTELAEATRPAPAGLRISRVHNEQELDVWAETLAKGFGEGEREATWVASVYREAGFGDAGPWRHYLAHLDGTPVATATIFTTADIAGVYFVMTVPEARRQGIGAAITRHGLLDAREHGHRLGVLQSSDPGRPVYEALGFRQYCTFELYEAPL